ncbi:anti-sigma factor [Povalibacter sp.]|uniref:anti-sigma factor n=1 Tax=Povalibacter sp. TaxID=1962978 RepID=UPI002F3EAD31
MNYSHAQLLDELAAQYALGTLRGSARRRFERLCEQNPLALRALHRWEERLIDLASGIAPVRPSDAVWRGVQQRIRAASAASRRGQRWSLANLAMAATVLLAVAVSLWIFLGWQQHDLVARFTDQQQTELWRIEATSRGDELQIATTSAVTLDPDHAYELWALPESGAAPISLGILPQRGKATLSLNATQRQALTSAAKVAISREPPSGSPTGAPTGPVLYVAAVVIEA